MESAYIREFLLFVEEMNYSRAAKRLFISGNALASHISKLEDELGVKLVVHGPQRPILTPAGRAFIRQANKVIREIDSLVHACKQAENSVTVRLVGQQFPKYTRALYRAMHIMEMQTGIQFSVAISNQSTTSLSELIAQPQADATFWIKPRGIENEPMSNFPEGMNGTLVGTEGLFLCISHDNPLFEKEVIGIEDMQGQEFAYTADPGYQEGMGIIVNAFEKRGVSIETSATQGSTAFEYLYNSLPDRITWWSESTIELGGLKENADFRFVNLEDLRLVYDVYFVYRRERPYLDELAALFQTQPFDQQGSDDVFKKNK